MHKQAIVSAFALACVAAAPAAQAQISDTVSVSVSVAGLDMNSDTGAQIALRRIKNAAEKICGGEPSRTLQHQQKFKPCVTEVTQRTVADLNQPRLTALLSPAPQARLAKR